MESRGKKILIIIENLPAPFDRRVWQEAQTLTKAGYQVSIICPKGKGFDKWREVIDGIAIYRHPLPIEARRAVGYFFEYACALFWEFVLSVRVFFERGFDVIQACNPPDLIFLVGGFYKIFRKRFVFDHHDLTPELWLAKGRQKDLFYKSLVLCEKLTFKTANISIATNESYKKIAIERGGRKESTVFVVRSAPQTEKLEKLIPKSPNEGLKNGKRFMVGYVGVMARQDGVDYLLRAVEYIVKKKQRTDIYFVMIGKGPEWDILVKMTKDMGIAEYALFTGRIPDKEMVDYLYACDVCVNPDEANDFNDKSTMNKVMEYMALGKPIVQFEMREGRFSAQEASLYARPNDVEDFGDKILELLDNARQRKEMGAYGQRRLEEALSWGKSEQELLKAYKYLFESLYGN